MNTNAKIGIVFYFSINFQAKLFGASLPCPIKVWYFIKIVAFEAEYRLVRVADGVLKTQTIGQ